ncbi:hypothetical protein SRHO_G00295480 [Serrasalmus rhombeus]
MKAAGAPEDSSLSVSKRERETEKERERMSAFSGVPNPSALDWTAWGQRLPSIWSFVAGASRSILTCFQSTSRTLPCASAHGWGKLMRERLERTLMGLSLVAAGSPAANEHLTTAGVIEKMTSRTKHTAQRYTAMHMHQAGLKLF